MLGDFLVASADFTSIDWADLFISEKSRPDDYDGIRSYL